MDNRDNNRRRDNRRDNAPVEEKQYDERVIAVDRVARVVQGGRRFRFRSLVVVGDKKGKVGIGIAKGADVTTATTKATESAKKNMITVCLHKGTIPHEVSAKVGGASLIIKPAAPGTGLIAGSTTRIVLEVVGVQNVISKALGSSNKINACYATLEALSQLQSKKNWTVTGGKEAQAAAAKAKKKVPTKAEVK